MNTQYRNFFSMGTRLDAVFIDVNDKHADMLAALIKNDLDTLENVLSIYRPDSELSILNRTALKKDASVSQDLFEAVSLCFEYYKLTGGIFDPGRAVLTGYTAGKGKNEEEDVNNLLASSGMELVEINEDKRTIRYHGEHVKIDVGGFGKGLAMNSVNGILVAENIVNALISFGESTILAKGSHPHGNHWPVAVSGLFNKQSVARVARLNDKSISTSGTGFVDASGIFRPSRNIIDPRTGKTVDDPITVSFISDDPLEAEVLSTSLLIDPDCLSEEFDRTGKEAFAVIYDDSKKFAVKEIL
ncbi:MAG: FAD:protein FMN transferase [Bacteroidota bacterium]|nr:FAD:protein FMN transferase [Bacteroidota bacterium]